MLSGRVAQLKPLRYTPAGVPALDLELTHTSQATEAGAPRQVTLTLRCLALGTVAERLAAQAIGTTGRFQGFLANRGRSKSVLFHIQDFHKD